MNTPRTAIVAIAVPAHVTDQELANRLWRLLRQALQPPDPPDPAFVFPDPASLEVTVYGCAAAELFSKEGTPSS
jgi:hypothetical protein